MTPDVLVQSTTVPVAKSKPTPIPGFYSLIPLPKKVNRALCFKAIEALIDEAEYDTTHLTFTEMKYVKQVVREWVDRTKAQ